jgi:hypothetical protein
LTVNVLEVAPVSPPFSLSLAVSVLALPAVVGLIAPNVATPLEAFTLNVLLPVKPVVLLPIVTLLLSLVTVLP